MVTIKEIRIEGMRLAKFPAAATVGSLMLLIMPLMVSSRLAAKVFSPSCTFPGRSAKIWEVLSPI